MAGPSDQERTERATPKKREDARRRGEVAKSREVVSTTVYLFVVAVLYLAGPYLFERLLAMVRGYLSQATAVTVTLANLNQMSVHALGQFLLILAPIMAVGVVAAVTGNVMQFGFLMTGETLVPDIGKLNPLKGLGRLVSKQAFMEASKSVAKIMIVAALAYSVIRNEFLHRLPTVGAMEVEGIFLYVTQVSFTLLMRVLWFLMVLSVIDYLFQRWQYEEKLKMTKQEVKDEYKQREGDPLVKARVRSIQREMARRRMLAEVPGADVVVTNPTRLAVALKYDPDKGPAPRVVAKGANFIAEKIRELARQHGVPLVEDKPLARALYKGVPLGGFVPENLYRAVAEILAYVYSLKRRRSQDIPGRP